MLKFLKFDSFFKIIVEYYVFSFLLIWDAYNLTLCNINELASKFKLRSVPDCNLTLCNINKLASKFKLRAVPACNLTLCNIIENDKEIMRTVGYKTEELDKLIEKFKK